MKKHLMTLGLMLGMLSLTGCQKDNTDSSVEIENGKMITRTFTVGGDWAEEVRSYYEEGEGVLLSGDEEISVYWNDAKYAANNTETASKPERIKGRPTETPFEYEFTHKAIEGAEAYDYYFIMPNTTTNNQQSKGIRPMVYLNTIQEPKANSFDPAQDYLLGQPLLGQSEVTEAATVKFKRIFAPLRMTVKNGGLLQEGEKILYATISQSATCERNKPLVGSAYFRFSPSNDDPEKSDKFEDASIASILSSSYGNKVTAFYPNGLEADAEGNFPVWYIINPSDIEKKDEPTTISGDMTITLITDSRMISRTVTLANPMKFAANQLNKFSITFGESANVVAGEAVTTAFANYANLAEIEGWSFEGCTYSNNAVEIKKGAANKITLPTVAGKKISKIIALPSLYHPNNSSANTLDLYAGEEMVGNYNFNLQKMLLQSENMYGYLIIDVPTEYQTADLSLVKPTDDGANTSLRAITLIYEDSTAPDATVELASAESSSLTFDVALANASKYYYLLQAAEQEAPTAEAVVSTGTESTATELTIENLSEGTEYVLYVIPVGENDAQGALVSAEGKTTQETYTDYWAMYEAGEDIQVGDMIVNKTTHPEAKLVYMDSEESEDKIRTSILQKGGLIFLDTYTNEDGSEAEDQVLTLTNNYQPAAETIIIGRWINKQSKIECATYISSGEETGTYFAIDKVVGGGVAFKNLEWVGNALTKQLLVRGGNIANDIDYFIVEDCTMTAYQHLYRYSNTGKKFVIKKSIFRNNIIKMLGTADNYNVASITKDNTNLVDYDKIDLIEFTNNVIICPESVDANKRRMLIDYGSGGAGYLFDMTKMAIVVKNNTFYNLHASSNVLVRAFLCGSALIEGNLAYVDGTDATKVKANCYLFGLYAHNDGTTTANPELKDTEEALYRVVNNFAASYNMTATNSNGSVQNGWTFLYKDGQPVYYYDTNNKSSFKSATANHVFTTVNFETGYLPVNTTVVNNGAGASYETKLWRIWE